MAPLARYFWSSPTKEVGSRTNLSCADNGSFGRANAISTGNAISGSFDPAPLERAAKALRELEASTNSQKAFQLATLAENNVTKKLDLDLQKANLESRKVALAHIQKEEQERRNWERFRNDEELRVEKTRRQIELSMELEKKRQQEKAAEEAARRSMEDFLAKEKIRLATDVELMRKKDQARNKEAAREENLIRVRIREKYKWKARQERENKDIAKELLEVNLRSKAKTAESISKMILGTMSQASNLLINDTMVRQRTFAALLACSLALFGTAQGSKAMKEIFVTTALQPRLVSTTTIWSFSNMFPWLARVQLGRNLRSTPLVLPSHKASAVQRLIKSVNNSSTKSFPLQNALFYGPPGTGKTLAAQHIAFASNCHFALVSAGSLITLGSRGSHELERMFKWARKSARRKPLVLFIDECEALLHNGRESKTNQFAMTENGRSTLSTFLAETGNSSRRLMIILATNVADALDDAVKDRMDTFLQFDLPTDSDRRAIIRKLLRRWKAQPAVRQGLADKIMKYVLMPFTSKLTPLSVEDLENFMDEHRLVEETRNMSCRQVEKYVLGHLQAGLPGQYLRDTQVVEVFR